MSDHPSHPEDFSPEDRIMFGLPSHGSTPPVELPANIEKILADALKKPPEEAEAAPAEPTILPGQIEHDLSESQASAESMAEVIRQGTPPGEVAEIRAREGRTIKEGRTPTLNPEQDEQQPLLLEVQGIMQQELKLMNRITEHEEDMPSWKDERDSIEQVYSSVVRAYNDYRNKKIPAEDLVKEIQFARTTLEGYDLLLSPESE